MFVKSTGTSTSMESDNREILAKRLSKAIRSNNYSEVEKQLLEKAPTYWMWLFMDKKLPYYSALDQIASEGCEDEKIVDLLLERAYDFTSCEDEDLLNVGGVTPLINSVKRNNQKIFKRLVKYSSSPEIYHHNIVYLYDKGYIEQADALLDENLSPRYLAYILQVELTSGLCEEDTVIGHILSRGIDMNTRDGDGKTALHWSSACASIEATKWLIDAGADVGVVDEEKRRPDQVASGPAIRAMLEHKLLEHHIAEDNPTDVEGECHPGLIL